MTVNLCPKTTVILSKAKDPNDVPRAGTARFFQPWNYCRLIQDGIQVEKPEMPQVREAHLGIRANTRPRTATALALLSMLALTGCGKKVIAATTPPPPPTPTVSIPPPTHPTEPMAEAPVIVSESIPVPIEPAKKPTIPRQHTKPVAPTQTASIAPPPVTELGELTTGGESNNDTFRRQTDDLLKSQNRRLSGLPPHAITLHTQQVEQARLFLRQAGEAWNKQDIEGARTLGIKAKVLLDEILQ